MAISNPKPAFFLAVLVVVAGLVGLGLWPAILLHAVLAVWCLVGLQTARQAGTDRAQS